MDPFGFETSAAWQDTPSFSPSLSPPVASTSDSVLVSAPPPVPTSSGITLPNDGFDEFDEFTPAPVTMEAAEGGEEEDDFGDFGDFGDPEPVAAIAAQPNAFSTHMEDDEFGFGDENVFQPAKMAGWQPIRVKPLPDPLELSQQLRDLLAPVLRGPDVDALLSGEGIRQIESSAQLLVTPESRLLYKVLIQDSAPQLQPPNWTRSRIRRQHLITLGIPVNLDEVNPHANGKVMPAINIITRPASAPPRPRSQVGQRGANGPATPSRPGTPATGGGPHWGAIYAPSTIKSLGPKPEMDQQKVEEVLGLDPDTLPLLPLPRLEAHLTTLRSLTVNASLLLTHLLQTREVLQQDAETYNKVISQYINQAQQQQLSKGARPNKRGTMG